MVITPSNELDAVNEILSSIGSSPVNSIEDGQNVDVINAKRILEGVSKEIQSRGWGFNTLSSIALSADRDGLVPCPYSYLRFFSDGYQLVRREGYFYDMASDTQIFTGGLTIDELVKELDFDALPDVFRKYITVRASRVFQMRYLSAQELDQALAQEEAMAYSDIVDYDLMQGAYNIYDDDQTISQNIQRS